MNDLISSISSLTAYIKKFVDSSRGAPIPKEFSLIFSSDPVNGASNLSTGPNNAGSSFQVVLSQPLFIPKEAISAELRVTTFIGWWTILNIIYQFNDMFQFQILSGSSMGLYSVEVPPGIYSLNSLASAINIQLMNAYPTLPPNPLTFSADQSTQRVIIIFNIAACQVDFSITNSMRNIMGFDGLTSSIQILPQVNQDIIPDIVLFPGGSFVNQSVYANSTAKFNT
jgi:hypothetical protein